ncbi:zinc ribbon domain-containing protein [candidate division WOR-3 bacterium]|nr:zinc ribbon domain-containing protein [candidate division WOR-3 bacterium]
MPIYEYRCEPCGRTVEWLRRAGEADEPVECPDCGKPMERVFSVPGGIRMGTGRAPGTTCCGRSERCDSPPCGDGSCRRDY